MRCLTWNMEYLSCHYIGLSKYIFVRSSPKVGRVLEGDLSKMTEVVPFLLPNLNRHLWEYEAIRYLILKIKRPIY